MAAEEICCWVALRAHVLPPPASFFLLLPPAGRTAAAGGHWLRSMMLVALPWAGRRRVPPSTRLSLLIQCSSIHRAAGRPTRNNILGTYYLPSRQGARVAPRSTGWLCLCS